MFTIEDFLQRKMDDLLRWAEEGSITLEEFKQIWKQTQEAGDDARRNIQCGTGRGNG